MTTHMLNRRDLLGTTAKALGAFAAFGGTVSILPNSAGAKDCIANHRKLAQNLKELVLDPAVSQAEKDFAIKTCRCTHCDVAIAGA